MTGLSDPCELLRRTFGEGGEIGVVSAPGRVNLIGEHIDYHQLPVLPMALERGVRLAYRRRSDRRIHAVSSTFGLREFEWIPRLVPGGSGDWENYLRAAAQAISGKWGVGMGIDAAIVSDLPAAAGLSSSSALIVAMTLGLLRANGYNPGFEELMQVLPEGEHFVGTSGGGMDHAASLASRAGHATLIGFAPLSVRHIPVPQDWCFLVADSLVRAEKSGAARERYNAARAAGSRALCTLGLPSYSNADPSLETRLTNADERGAFRHVTGEALRVHAAVDALERDDAPAFGKLLVESHASLRDLLRVSCPELDLLVDAALASGAAGARLTGAGFGGCAVILTNRAQREAVRCGMIERYYRGRPGFDPAAHLMDAQPAAGALCGGEHPICN